MSPVETPSRVRVAGGWIAYTRAGSGPPVVLIHGLGSSRRTWRHCASRLAQTNTVIALDLPGHGASDPPLGDYSPAAHAAALRDLLWELNLPVVHLVGHSLGGGIALSFLHLFPDRVDSITLIASGGLGPQVTPLLRAATVPGADTALKILGSLPPAVRRAALQGVATVPAVLSRDDIDPLSDCFATLESDRTRRTFVRTSRAVLGWWGQSARAGEHVAMLRERRVMLIWGDDDRTIPPRHHRALAARFPHARQVEVAGAGHFPHETAAAVVAPALEEFLACR